MTPQEKITYCQTVARLLIVDAVLTDDESRFLRAVMDHLEMPEEDRDAVLNGVNLGDEVDQTLSGLSASEKQNLLFTLQDAAAADGRFSIQESLLMDRVRKALGGV